MGHPWTNRARILRAVDDHPRREIEEKNGGIPADKANGRWAPLILSLVSMMAWSLPHTNINFRRLRAPTERFFFILYFLFENYYFFAFDQPRFISFPKYKQIKNKKFEFIHISCNSWISEVIISSLWYVHSRWLKFTITMNHTFVKHQSENNNQELQVVVYNQFKKSGLSRFELNGLSPCCYVVPFHRQVCRKTPKINSTLLF